MKQHIYEKHPAMYIFDGFSSFMTAYTEGRREILKRFGDIDLGKLINKFRNHVLERNQIDAFRRFNVFRDMCSSVS